jgi:hypothetical protein
MSASRLSKCEYTTGLLTPAALASVSIRSASDPLPSRRDSAMSRSCRRRSCGCVRGARTRWGREVLAVDTFDTVRQ